MKLSWIDSVLAISAATITSVVLLQYWESRHLVIGEPQRYLPGDTIPGLPGVDFTKTPQSLVFFIRSTCSACTASMQTYQRLVAEHDKERTQFVFVSTEDPGTSASYLRLHGVVPDAIATSRGANLKMLPTPTLLLVGTDGKVTRSWVGRLSDDYTDGLIAFLHAPDDNTLLKGGTK